MSLRSEVCTSSLGRAGGRPGPCRMCGPRLGKESLLNLMNAPTVLYTALEPLLILLIWEKSKDESPLSTQVTRIRFKRKEKRIAMLGFLC